MKKSEIVNMSVDKVMDYLMDDLQVSGPGVRAKLYRKTGLQLVSLAAAIEAELLYKEGL